MFKQWKTLAAKALIVMGLVSLVTACGFHLRGAQDVPEAMRQVTLQTGPASPQLVRSLKQNMRFNGIQQQASAPYQIEIIGYRYKRRAATIDRNSDVDEYELSLMVSFLVKDQQGKALSTDIQIQLERIYSYDKDAAAASSEHEALLREEMFNAAAQSIIRRYLALKPAA